MEITRQIFYRNCIVCSELFFARPKDYLCLCCKTNIQDTWLKDKIDSSLNDYMNSIVLANQLEKL